MNDAESEKTRIARTLDLKDEETARLVEQYAPHAVVEQYAPHAVERLSPDPGVVWDRDGTACFPVAVCVGPFDPEGNPCSGCGSFGDNLDHWRQGVAWYMMGPNPEPELLCHPCFRKKSQAGRAKASYINRKGREFSVETKRKVLECDGYRCVECGSTESPHVDHIIPAIEGGDGSMENAQVLCRICNSRKRAGGNRPGAEDEYSL